MTRRAIATCGPGSPGDTPSDAGSVAAGRWYAGSLWPDAWPATDPASTRVAHQIACPVMRVAPFRAPPPEAKASWRTKQASPRPAITEYHISGRRIEKIL